MLSTDFNYQKANLLTMSVPDEMIASAFITYCARVSNPESQAAGLNDERLIKYLIRNKHWSPFEMVSAVMEITTTRDISRQILRHTSFHFQEFSQRYASVDAPFIIREARAQDHKNRQNSLDIADQDTNLWWHEAQKKVAETVSAVYSEALSDKRGIAKEQARAILPEGMTMTKLYMAGTLRSWKHYIDLRSANGTQREHMDIALKCKQALIDKSLDLKWIFENNESID